MAWLHRMKEGQKDIFYMAADSLNAASSAPFVERLVQRDFEVNTKTPSAHACQFHFTNITFCVLGTNMGRHTKFCSHSFICSQSFMHTCIDAD